MFAYLNEVEEDLRVEMDEINIPFEISIVGWGFYKSDNLLH